MEDAKRVAKEQSDRIVGLHADERNVGVDALLELADFDSHRRYEALGYARLGHYCEDVLKLERWQIYVRIDAARVLRKFPIAIEYLRDGRVTMSSLAVMQDVLSEENVKQWLTRASGKSKEDVVEMIARSKPKQPAPKPMLRKLPQPPLVEAEEVRTPAPPVTLVKPVCEDLFLLRVGITQAFKDKLARAKSILSHSIPDGDVVAVLERALDLLLERENKRHGPPRKADPVLAVVSGSERPHIPADLERLVWTRDDGKCVWELASGKRCGSEYQLQIDHVIAVALGGKTDLDNLRLLCRAHNLLHARQTFGEEFVARAIARKR